MQYNPQINIDSMENIIPLNHAINHWNDNHYDHESAGDYSATDLINPPRIVQLKKRHQDDLELPIASQMNAFFGTAVHDKYEQSLTNNSDYDLEQRVKQKINGRVVTGKFDILYKKQHIYDVKTTRTWKVVFDPFLKDWHEQQNIYAFLLRNRGYDIQSINIITHYYDWISNMAVRDQSYPQQSVIQYSLSLWNESTISNFIVGRLELHKNCENFSDDDLPECTPEDRWERLPNGDTVQYALFRNSTTKRATKLFRSLEESIEYGRSAKNHGSDAFIEVRYAQRKRCEKYCAVAKHCNYYQEYLNKINTGTLNDYIPLYN